MSAGGREPAAPSLISSLSEAMASVGGLVGDFTASGHRLYLVGGAVRDLLVATTGPPSGVDLVDLDFTTDATPDRIVQLVEPHAAAVWTQGARFGTIGAKIGARLVEITTHRAEAYDETSRKPAVTFGQSIDDDLARRDFTINAIALSLPDGELVDPFGGRADLTAGVLRTPLEPSVSFTDDPLRIMRAARFIARFHLQPTTELVAAAASGSERLVIVSAERVQAELEKQLAVDEPGPGFAFLDRTGVLDHVIPELSVVDHAGRAEAIALAAAPGSPLVRRAGLLLPLRGRDAVGVLRGLRYGRVDTTETAHLLDAIDLILDRPMTDGLARTVVHSIGLDRIPDLTRLSGNIRRHRQLAAPDPLSETVDRLGAEEDLSDLEPPVSGGDLIAHLDLEPGPIVGKAVSYLESRRLETGPMTVDEALAAVEAWLADTSGS